MNADRATIHFVESDSDLQQQVVRLFKMPGCEVCCYAGFADFLEQYRSDGPGCIVLGLDPPHAEGLEAHQRLTAGGDDTPVIFLAGNADVTTAVRAMQQGAFDFLEKPVQERVLLQRVKDAIALDQQRHERRAELKPIRSRLGRLTRRERQILQLLTVGKSSEQIASAINLSHRTVQNHRARILKKMAARNSVDLVRMALSAD